MGGRGPDPMLRVLAVVGLLAVAALALQARQGLDWGELSDPVEVRWARVLFGTVVLLVLLAVARRLLRRRRRERPGGGEDEETEPEGEQFSWWLRGLGALVVLAVLGMVWFLINSFGPAGQSARNPPPPLVPGSTPPSDPAAGLDTGSSWQILLLAAAVLLATAIGSRWLAARRAHQTEPVPDTEELAEVERLVAAVDAADDELDSSLGPREAILAAYAAMARHLSRGLARQGRESRPSDTAGELLDHAVEAGLVSGAPPRTLTDLFREARFSTHPMGEPARATARRALAEVRSQLTARRG